MSANSTHMRGEENPVDVDKNFRKAISADITPKEAFKSIANVSKWWTSHFKGNTVKLNSTFRLSFGENWFAFKVVESIPGKKLVWLVTDCYMPWLDNEKEWKGTRVVWSISEGKNGTRIEMTHVGLVPAVECYDTCKVGWDNYVGKSLPKLIETGMGVLFDD